MQLSPIFPRVETTLKLGLASMALLDPKDMYVKGRHVLVANHACSIPRASRSRRSMVNKVFDSGGSADLPSSAGLPDTKVERLEVTNGVLLALPVGPFLFRADSAFESTFDLCPRIRRTLASSSDKARVSASAVTFLLEPSRFRRLRNLGPLAVSLL